jgi:hypothetical protein
MSPHDYVRRQDRPGLPREVVQVFTWDGGEDTVAALTERYVTIIPSPFADEPSVIWTFRVFTDGERTPWKLLVHPGDRIILRAPERDRGAMVCRPGEPWLDLNYEPVDPIAVDDLG